MWALGAYLVYYLSNEIAIDGPLAIAIALLMNVVGIGVLTHIFSPKQIVNFHR